MLNDAQPAVPSDGTCAPTPHPLHLPEKGHNDELLDGGSSSGFSTLDSGVEDLYMPGQELPAPCHLYGDSLEDQVSP